jgi:hypothetical protein
MRTRPRLDRDGDALGDIFAIQLESVRAARQRQRQRRHAAALAVDRDRSARRLRDNGELTRWNRRALSPFRDAEGRDDERCVGDTATMTHHRRVTLPFAGKSSIAPSAAFVNVSASE